MRATTVIFTCIVLSIALVACQYAEADRATRTSEPTPATVTEDETLQATATPSPEPTEEPAFAGADWVERGRLTVLISGSDAGPGREGARTDAMMVASLDIETGQTILLGVPRNYGDLPVPEDIASVMGVTEYTGMLKWLYGEAQAYPELAPEGGDPGMVALKGVISALLDIHIDYYAMVDMAGFIELIDAFGGVEIEVREPIIVRLQSPMEGDDWQQFEIMPGVHTFDGREALAYSRHRTGTTDYDRMERQRCLVTSVTRQADLPTLLVTFPDLVDVIREHVVTDIPLEMLPDLIMLRDNIQMDDILMIGFNPPDYLIGPSSEGHNLPNIDAIRETTRQALEDPGQLMESEGERGTNELHC